MARDILNFPKVQADDLFHIRSSALIERRLDFF